MKYSSTNINIFDILQQISNESRLTLGYETQCQGQLGSQKELSAPFLCKCHKCFLCRCHKCFLCLLRCTEYQTEGYKIVSADLDVEIAITRACDGDNLGS